MLGRATGSFGSGTEPAAAILAAMLLLVPVLPAGVLAATSPSGASGELLWYTPHDTPWSDWTVLEGSGVLPIHEETWGPTVRFEGDGDEPVIRSPAMEDWDRAVVWWQVEGELGSTDAADLFELLDAQGEPVMMVLIDDGGLEFWPWDPDLQEWDPMSKESIHSTPILSGDWNRLEIAPSAEEIRVSFGDGTVTLPNRSGDPTYLQASPADPWNGVLDWSLGGLRVTQGAPVDEAFDSDALDPRLLVEATDALAKAEVTPRQKADPDRGLIEVQGSLLPDGRALAAAPVDGFSDAVLVETSFRIYGQHTWNQPTHQALLAGLRDDAGAPGEATWQLAFSPVWLEEQRQEPTDGQDPVPDPSANGEPWGLYLHVQHKAPQRLATFDAVEPGTWHMLAVTVGENGGTIWLDREPLGTYGLWPQGWVAIGDVEGRGAPVADRAGGGLNAIAHSGLFVASAGPTEIGGELAWYTPHDTPWDQWTGDVDQLSDGEASWGPYKRLDPANGEPVVRSPALDGADSIAVFLGGDVPSSGEAGLFDVLDQHGDTIFTLGFEDDVLEAWKPGQAPTSFDRLHSPRLSSLEQLTLEVREHEVEVFKGGGSLTVPLQPGLEPTFLKFGSSPFQHALNLMAVRVTEGSVLDERFDASTIDPRLTVVDGDEPVDRPLGGPHATVEHRSVCSAAPSGGCLAIEGSGLPDERALVAAPLDPIPAPLLIETGFRKLGGPILAEPDHHAVLAGLADEDGAPGEPVWSLSLSAVWTEERRQEPLGESTVPSGRLLGMPLGLYLDDGMGEPALVTTIEGDRRWPSHLVTAELDPEHGTLQVSVDRQDHGAFPVDLPGTHWLAMGDVSREAAPYAERTGGYGSAVGHGGLLVTATAPSIPTPELLWDTPQDTAWTLWTDQDGDPPATEAGTFGPQVTLGSADQGTIVASPSLSGADRAVLWFESQEDSSHLTRWAHLTDASGTRLLSLGQAHGSFHLFVPGEEDPRALPWAGGGHLSGPDRLELILEDDAILVGFRGNTDRVTVPADTALGHLELQAPTDDEGTVHGAIGFLGARATRGPVLDETFNGPTVDPRLHPGQTYEASGGNEQQDSFTGARDRGRWAIEGSPLPEGRVFLSAPTDGVGGSYMAETVVRPTGIHWGDQPDGIAALAGLQDPSSDQPAWALVLSPTDRSLDGSSLDLHLALPDGTSTALTTFHVGPNLVHSAHLLRVTVNAPAGTLEIRVDGEPQGSFAVADLATVEAVAVGDLEPGAAPLVGGTGADLVPADGPDLLVESIFLAGLPEVSTHG